MCHSSTMNNRNSKICEQAAKLVNKNEAEISFWFTCFKKSISEYSLKQSTNPSDSNLKVENDIGPNIMNGTFKFVKKP